MSRFSEYFSVQLRRFKRNLTQIRDTPHAVAGGVAIGVLCGFTPLLGFKTLLALLAAWLCRCSKLAAILAVTFHDILLPLMPLILRWQFQVGYYLITSPHQLPPKLRYKHLHFENYISWKTLHILWPTFVGSIVLGVPIAVGTYFIVFQILKRAQAVRARHDHQNASQ
jgi:uncharacterized protein (DUF2062 family)